MMFLKFKFQIAVILFAAIFVFKPQVLAGPLTLDKIKAKISPMLILKKKAEALKYISEQQNLAGFSKEEILNLQILVASQFLLEETQSQYEKSLSFDFIDNSQALKQAQSCLVTDPQQLLCLIQKYKLLYRENNKIDLTPFHIEVKKIAPNTFFDQWSFYLGKKSSKEFFKKTFLKTLASKNSEEGFVLAVLEIDRSFAVKNYSKAKDLIKYFEKNYADWPDLIYYEALLNLESTEDPLIKSNLNKDFLNKQTLYTNKCKTLSRTMVRKYKYDFDLCIRSFSI